MAVRGAGHTWAIAPIALLGLLLAGCGSSPPTGSPYGAYAGHGIGTYRVGSPYKVKGIRYYPAVDYDFDKTGTASWYGGQFEGRLTANGEIFDLNQLTAAHTTLPMPSIVQVTNLENGRSLQLRVNDRGPFADGRLIDVSRRAAQLLGFEKKGTTLVEVKVLKDESIAAADEAMHGGGQVLVAAAPSTAAAVRVASLPPRAVPAPVYSHTIAAPSAAAPSEPPPPPSPSPQIAMAPSEAPPPPQTEPAPPNEPLPPPLPQIAMAPGEAPPPRPARPPLSRFALIAPAEAAELPPPRASARRSEIAAAPNPIPRTPPSAPRVAGAGSGRIFVQAGAFSMRDNAQKVQSRIARLGSVQVSATSVNGVEMYRVRLGPFGSEEQANRLLARVVDSGCPGARIVGD